MHSEKIMVGIRLRQWVPLLLLLMMGAIRIVAQPVASVEAASEPGMIVAAPVLQADDDGDSWWEEMTGNLENILKTAVVLMWFTAAIGIVLLVIAHFAQPVLPSWYQGLKGYLQTGIVLTVVVNLALTYISMNLEDFTNETYDFSGSPTWGS
jgi:hypothetical protein